MTQKFITKEFNVEKHTGKLSPFGKEKISIRDEAKLTQGNIIYIYKGDSNIYIGQTKHFYARHKEHCDEQSLRYVDGSYKKVIVAFGSLINQQSLDDIEKQLITYITADYDHKKLLVDNNTKGNDSITYVNQDDVLTDFIYPFWKLLYAKNYVLAQNINLVKESILFKYSPFTKLTDEKKMIIKEIASKDSNYLVKGLAGTGKTVVLTNLASKLHSIHPEKKIGIVVKSNWVDIAKSIFNAFNIKNIAVTTAYKLIKSQEKFDYVLIDEAHRLRRYYSKGNHVTQDIFHKDPSQNELNLLQPLGNQFILFYDPAQTIRPNDIPRKDFLGFVNSHDFKQLSLTKEYRINIYEEGQPFTSDDYINGILSFLQIREQNDSFNKDLFKSYLYNPDAYFGIVNSIQELFDYLNYSEQYNSATQNRVMAGYTRPWKSKKDKSAFDWLEGSHHWKWNSTSENWLNKKNSRQEIGSIHAVQGIDLNFTGVIISNDIGLNKNGEIIGKPDNYKDRNGKYKKTDYDPEQFSNFIKDVYYVLLTRGIDGVRVYFEDSEMENYFYRFMNIPQK